MIAEFDKYANEYELLVSENIRISGYPSSYFDEQKVREVSRRVGHQLKGPFNFLNFGCGIGKSEKFIRKYFPESSIFSADVSAESIKRAKEYNESITNISYFHFVDINTFDPGARFDIIFVANVFHHIPEQLHYDTLHQLHKLLSPNGKLFIFEHNPINPLTRRAFHTCEFDKGCKMIPFGKLKTKILKVGLEHIEINFTLFFPGSLKFMNPFEKYLAWLPIGAQYYAIGYNSIDA